ncbi:hypothetical protein [Aeromonas salmonicida]|jgi:hypothetical protein|uniref:hypothetical protein n=1 Tax=Aeromonas salmonicida TaxID=645 RepID=UPI0031FE0B83
MTEGEYFSEQLIIFIENHKDDFTDSYETFIEILRDKDSSIPIRAIWERVRKCDPSKYTDEEKDLLREAMHNYG